MASETKILYASDLHGHQDLYTNLISNVKVHQPSILLLGGDLTPKFKSSNCLVADQIKFLKNLRDYFYQIKSHQPDIEIGFILGNDDFIASKLELQNLIHSNLATLLDKQLWVTNSGWEILGFDLVPETPFSLKDHERLDTADCKVKFYLESIVVSHDNHLRTSKQWFENHKTLQEELEILPKFSNPNKSILVAHAPPYETDLDLMIGNRHVGSKSIKNYLLNEQPRISLHGHIHESHMLTKKYSYYVGKTLSFNPGQMHLPDLDSVLITISDSKLSHRFIGKTTASSKEAFSYLQGINSK